MFKIPNIWFFLTSHALVIIFAITSNASVGDVIYIYVYQQIVILLICFPLLKKIKKLDQESGAVPSDIGQMTYTPGGNLILNGLVPLIFFKSLKLTITPEYKMTVFLLIVPFAVEFLHKVNSEIKLAKASKLVVIDKIINKEVVPRFIVLHLMVFVVAFATQGGEGEGNVFIVLFFLMLAEMYVYFYWLKGQQVKY